MYEPSASAKKLITKLFIILLTVPSVHPKAFPKPPTQVEIQIEPDLDQKFQMTCIDKFRQSMNFNTISENRLLLYKPSDGSPAVLLFFPMTSALCSTHKETDGIYDKGAKFVYFERGKVYVMTEKNHLRRLELPLEVEKILRNELTSGRAGSEVLGRHPNMEKLLFQLIVFKDHSVTKNGRSGGKVKNFDRVNDPYVKIHKLIPRGELSEFEDDDDLENKFLNRKGGLQGRILEEVESEKQLQNPHKEIESKMEIKQKNDQATENKETKGLQVEKMFLKPFQVLYNVIKGSNKNKEKEVNQKKTNMENQNETESKHSSNDHSTSKSKIEHKNPDKHQRIRKLKRDSGFDTKSKRIIIRKANSFADINPERELLDEDDFETQYYNHKITTGTMPGARRLADCEGENCPKNESADSSSDTGEQKQKESQKDVEHEDEKTTEQKKEEEEGDAKSKSNPSSETQEVVVNQSAEEKKSESNKVEDPKVDDSASISNENPSSQEKNKESRNLSQNNSELNQEILDKLDEKLQNLQDRLLKKTNNSDQNDRKLDLKEISDDQYKEFLEIFDKVQDLEDQMHNIQKGNGQNMRKVGHMKLVDNYAAKLDKDLDDLNDKELDEFKNHLVNMENQVNKRIGGNRKLKDINLLDSKFLKKLENNQIVNHLKDVEKEIDLVLFKVKQDRKSNLKNNKNVHLIIKNLSENLQHLKDNDKETPVNQEMLSINPGRTLKDGPLDDREMDRMKKSDKATIDSLKRNFIGEKKELKRIFKVQQQMEQILEDITTPKASHSQLETKEVLNSANDPKSKKAQLLDENKKIKEKVDSMHKEITDLLAKKKDEFKKISEHYDKQIEEYNEKYPDQKINQQSLEIDDQEDHEAEPDQKIVEEDNLPQDKDEDQEDSQREENKDQYLQDPEDGLKNFMIGNNEPEDVKELSKNPLETPDDPDSQNDIQSSENEPNKNERELNVNDPEVFEIFSKLMKKYDGDIKQVENHLNEELGISNGRKLDDQNQKTNKTTEDDDDSEFNNPKPDSEQIDKKKLGELINKDQFKSFLKTSKADKSNKSVLKLQEGEEIQDVDSSDSEDTNQKFDDFNESGLEKQESETLSKFETPKQEKIEEASEIIDKIIKDNSDIEVKIKENQKELKKIKEDIDNGEIGIERVNNFKSSESNSNRILKQLDNENINGTEKRRIRAVKRIVKGLKSQLNDETLGDTKVRIQSEVDGQKWIDKARKMQGVSGGRMLDVDSEKQEIEDKDDEKVEDPSENQKDETKEEDDENGDDKKEEEEETKDKDENGDEEIEEDQNKTEDSEQNNATETTPEEVEEDEPIDMIEDDEIDKNSKPLTQEDEDYPKSEDFQTPDLEAVPVDDDENLKNRNIRKLGLKTNKDKSNKFYSQAINELNKNLEMIKNDQVNFKSEKEEINYLKKLDSKLNQYKKNLEVKETQTKSPCNPESKDHNCGSNGESNSKTNPPNQANLNDKASPENIHPRILSEIKNEETKIPKDRKLTLYLESLDSKKFDHYSPVFMEMAFSHHDIIYKMSNPDYKMGGKAKSRLKLGIDLATALFDVRDWSIKFELKTDDLLPLIFSNKFFELMENFMIYKAKKQYSHNEAKVVRKELKKMMTKWKSSLQSSSVSLQFETLLELLNQKHPEFMRNIINANQSKMHKNLKEFCRDNFMNLYALNTLKKFKPNEDCSNCWEIIEQLVRNIVSRPIFPYDGRLTTAMYTLYPVFVSELTKVLDTSDSQISKSLESLKSLFLGSDLLRNYFLDMAHEKILEDIRPKIKEFGTKYFQAFFDLLADKNPGVKNISKKKFIRAFMYFMKNVDHYLHFNYQNIYDSLYPHRDMFTQAVIFSPAGYKGVRFKAMFGSAYQREAREVSKIDLQKVEKGFEKTGRVIRTVNGESSLSRGLRYF